MERDFTFARYAELLEEMIRSGRPVFPLRDYLQRSPSVPEVFILRHDVDRRPVNALKMAVLEHDKGLRATYYFRVRSGVFREDIIRRVAGLGHEVGYHYEVMDKARGDIGKAERVFAAELERFRRIVKVDTAAMHGNPLSARDNREIWNHVPLSRFNLLGEAYLSLRDPGLFYVTDTGRGWNRTARNLRDVFPKRTIGLLPPQGHTLDLMRTIRDGPYRRIYLQVHPNRWSWRRLQWFRQWAEDLLVNGVKILLAFGRKGRDR